MDEVDTTTTISRASVTTLKYTTQTFTNSWKINKTVQATISAASSMLEELVQTISNSYGSNKLPSIFQIEPMNNATQVFKKNEAEILEDTQEKWAQNWV